MAKRPPTAPSKPAKSPKASATPKKSGRAAPKKATGGDDDRTFRSSSSAPISSLVSFGAGQALVVQGFRKSSAPLPSVTMLDIGAMTATAELLGVDPAGGGAYAATPLGPDLVALALALPDGTSCLELRRAPKATLESQHPLVAPETTEDEAPRNLRPSELSAEAGVLAYATTHSVLLIGAGHARTVTLPLSSAPYAVHGGIAWGCQGDELVAFGLEGGKKGKELARHPAGGAALQRILARGSRLFASGEFGNGFFAWERDGVALRPLAALTDPGVTVTSFDASPEGARVAVGNASGWVDVLDAERGWSEPVSSGRVTKGHVYAVLVTPEHTLVGDGLGAVFSI